MVKWLPISVLMLAASGRAASADQRAESGDALATLETEQARLFAQVAPSVVLLFRDGAAGSGFAVTRDGLVLTNAHVVGTADEVGFQLLDGRHGRGRVLVSASGALDLALVRIPFTDLPPLAAGDAAVLRAGTYAATVGHGGGAAWTFSTGLVANPRPLGESSPMLLAQMALRPGSSGGPLVDRRGRVLGVVTAGTRDASGVTFAIRVDAAAAAFPQLVSWGAAPAGPPSPPPDAVDGSAGAVAAGPITEEGRVVISRLASPGEEESPETRASMKTVWKAPRSVRRAAGRTAVQSAPAPALAACEPSLACELPAAPPAPTPSLPWAAVLAAAAGGAATAGAMAVRHRRR